MQQTDLLLLCGCDHVHEPVLADKLAIAAAFLLHQGSCHHMYLHISSSKLLILSHENLPEVCPQLNVPAHVRQDERDGLRAAAAMGTSGGAMSEARQQEREELLLSLQVLIKCV